MAETRALKSAYLAVSETLCVCTGCARPVGGETFVLRDGETGDVIRCPECAEGGLL